MIDLESYIKLDNDIRQRPIVFQGTHAEWEALTSTQKAHYQYIAFTDDTGSPEVVDQVPTQNSTHLVQSGGVWSGLNTINQNFGSVEKSSTAAYPHRVGELFINAAGQMVKCTAAIAVGDSIVINTNVKFSTISKLKNTTVGNTYVDFSNVTYFNLSSCQNYLDILKIVRSAYPSQVGIIEFASGSNTLPSWIRSAFADDDDKWGVFVIFAVVHLTIYSDEALATNQEKFACLYFGSAGGTYRIYKDGVVKL